MTPALSEMMRVCACARLKHVQLSSLGIHFDYDSGFLSTLARTVW